MGDVCVFSLGDRQGQILTPQDLPVGGPPVIAYPMDGVTFQDGKARPNTLSVLATPPRSILRIAHGLGVDPHCALWPCCRCGWWTAG